MAYVLETEAFLDMVCELLEQGQTDVAIPVSGSSMVPFLHHGDTVCLNLVDSPLKRGDMLLPRRDLVRARVSFAKHRGRVCRPGSFRWWLYRYIWMWLRPVRYRLMRLRGKLN